MLSQYTISNLALGTQQALSNRCIQRHFSESTLLIILLRLAHTMNPKNW
jgi:hypothetical protein